MAELHGKLSEPKRSFSKSELDLANRDIGEIETVVEPELELPVLDDEADDRVLECAVAIRAVAIVTGDKGSLSLES